MSRKFWIAVVLALMPVAAQAHPGGHFGFAAGVAHPLGGADHVLAILAVGLWAAQAGGRAVWAMPLAFVAAMIAGGGMGAAGLVLPAVEPMILASVVVLGLAAALALRVPLLVAVAGIAVFGLAHGHAHGAGAEGGLLGYGAGFILATAGLLVTGLGVGLGLLRLGQARRLRALGLAVATAGLALGVAA